MTTSLFAITEAGGLSPGSHFVFAGLSYLLGIVFIVTRLVKGEIRNKSGQRMSPVAQLTTVLMFFSWGTLSLLSGLGHGIPSGYDISIRLGTLGLALVCGIMHSSTD